ncbi:threonylcarbamoyl-AMP synthase [Candidatus Saccharibacteria bacterium]|nr:threonylcarbamoyl-AMP synthase [Candidatus Saccharibacteria bacterium]
MAVALTSLDDAQLVELILQGAVGVLPTDTVYGLVCAAGNEAAVHRLYALKSRESKPGTVIAASIDQLTGLGIPRRYLTAVEQFWPNPLSIVIPCGKELAYLHQGKSSLAIRISSDTATATLLQKTGPLLTTSANQPGEVPAENIEQAKEYFGDTVDFYVDGGELSGRPPSTIIRIVDDAVEVLRKGALDIDENGRITNGSVRYCTPIYRSFRAD